MEEEITWAAIVLVSLVFGRIVFELTLAIFKVLKWKWRS